MQKIDEKILDVNRSRPAPRIVDPDLRSLATISDLGIRQAALRSTLRISDRVSRLLSPSAPSHSCFSLNTPWGHGYLDKIEADPSGLIRIEGWWEGPFDSESVPSVYVDGKPIPFLQAFRFNRPDVAHKSQDQWIDIGLGLDYLVPDALLGAFATLEVKVNGHTFPFPSAFTFIGPHYKELFASQTVYHRADIYGSGPPNSAVHPEVVELAKRLPAPILDFGCGRGALISQLRPLGIDAYGIEVAAEAMRAAIPPDLADRIKFYDGSFPSPFDDGEFNSVICSEVLEHIPDYQGAIRDIARIAKHSAVFTVPDSSTIPVTFRHGVVAWHLLEGTHVNFFNQASLTSQLLPYFRKVQVGRLGASTVNGTRTFVSLTAICSK